MRIIRDTAFMNDADRGASVAIGNFDGVHLGHTAVIDIARREADRIKAPLGVVTFEPHPRQFFAPDAPPFRLMNAEARASRLEKLGVARLYELNFGAALAGLTAEEFARDVLHGQLGLRHVVVGADFCFGKGRKGTVDDLQAFGQEYGFGTTIAPLVADAKGQFSSTNIRKALSEGRPADAARMLGHWHRIEGEVIRGEQRGRELGYPTANMSIAGLHPPKFGIYAARIDVMSGPHAGQYDGVANLGLRPMFDGQVPNLESHLFDFRGDLYGVHLSVALVAHLRAEERFDSIDTLITQMDRDSVAARKVLADV